MDADKQRTFDKTERELDAIFISEDDSGDDGSWYTCRICGRGGWGGGPDEHEADCGYAALIESLESLFEDI